MSNFIKELKSAPDFVQLNPATEADIKNAEKQLRLVFADEYKEYLSTFGVADGNGHEFTGICNSARLNVINVTKKQRGYFKDIPTSFYVVEEAHIDGIVVWQDKDGAVYQTEPGVKLEKIAKSIEDYFKS
jgi:hypothetical protein